MLHRINGGVQSRYRKQNRLLPLELKLLLLDTVPDLLKAEAKLLALTLNFVQFNHIREKAAYKYPLEVMKAARSWQADDQRAAKRFRTQLREALEKHVPRSFEKNFENNRRALYTDKENPDDQKA